MVSYQGESAGSEATARQGTKPRPHVIGDDFRTTNREKIRNPSFECASKKTCTKAHGSLPLEEVSLMQVSGVELEMTP